MKSILPILIALAPLAFSADEISWGPAVDGFRAGVALDQTATPPVLRVLVQNTTATARDIIVNQDPGFKQYPLEITTTSPDGKSIRMYDRTWDQRPALGIYRPEFTSMSAGGIYEFRMLLTDTVDYLNSWNLADALHKGYSVHVSTTGPVDSAMDVAKRLAVKLVSGELRLSVNDQIAWGAPDNGLRMGIALDQNSRALRVFVQNTLATARNIRAVLQCNTKIYPLEFTATSPEGKSIRIVDRNMPAGVMGPECLEYVRVDPGTNYEFRLALADLIKDGYPQASQPGLDSFLGAGYSLHVSADLQGDPYSGIRWTLTSGELRLPKQ